MMDQVLVGFSFSVHVDPISKCKCRILLMANKQSLYCDWGCLYNKRNLRTGLLCIELPVPHNHLTTAMGTNGLVFFFMSADVGNRFSGEAAKNSFPLFSFLATVL